MYNFDKNYFDYFINIIFYKNRRNIELLFEYLFSNFNSLKTEITIIILNDIKKIYNFNKILNEYNINNDNNVKKLKNLVVIIISSRKNK